MDKIKQPGLNSGIVENIRFAAYMRLSKTDGKEQKESNSISMQRILIRNYIASHFVGYGIVEYQDDGFPGTDFNRPGVQRLLEDARNEKFDCVVVKDFSRFGRDYVEVGSYIQQIFPFLGIRFISINDYFDSACVQGNTFNLDVNFRNLLYDLYSKDLSQKIKTSLKARKESGSYVSANAPFGYEKAPNDRHMLIICEDEAAVVRKIFSLAMQGVSAYQIAKKLNLENIPAPAEFKARKGKTSRKPKGDRFYWSGSTIYSILHNPVYVGDIEYGKTERNQVGGCNILKARAEWKVIRDHHAPVIARKYFEEVQKSMLKNKRKKKERGGNRHPFIGKAVCGCCKCSLQIRNGLDPYFNCQNRYVNGLSGCANKVNAMFLEQVVLFQLEEQISKEKLDKSVPGENGLLTTEVMERYIDKIIIYSEEEIEIMWKETR